MVAKAPSYDALLPEREAAEARSVSRLVFGRLGPRLAANQRNLDFLYLSRVSAALRSRPASTSSQPRLASSSKVRWMCSRSSRWRRTGRRVSTCLDVTCVGKSFIGSTFSEDRAAY